VNVSFSSKLAALRLQKSSVLCVGLDPDPSKMPAHLLADSTLSSAVVRFCTSIIEATETAAVAYKINFAFFEALGDSGMSALREVLHAIPEGSLTIADAKRGDIGNSASFYAQSVYDDLGFDSITLSPYMGKDSITPFLSFANTCSFVLARTSNPGGADFQNMVFEGKPLYLHVASKVEQWARECQGEGGLVVGATDIDSMARLRAACPEAPFLIPGVGSQGGSAKDVMDAAGIGPVLINSSRAIIYASSGLDFAERASEAAHQTQLDLGS
jgi:orotidine-5'-phosphate decarboxylase